MVFDLKLLSIRHNSRFAKCWLAATNPRLFHIYVRRSDVEKIKITSLCDDIWAEISKMSKQARIPLRLAAQLFYGTVCIYQQQVQFLYQNASHMVIMFRQVQVVLTKRPSVTAELLPKKKRKISSNSKKESENAEEVMSLIEESEQVPANEMTSFVQQITTPNPNKFTMRERYQDSRENDDMELFGEMTQNEKEAFFDLIQRRTIMEDGNPEELEIRNETNQISCCRQENNVKSIHDIAERQKRQYKNQKQIQMDVINNSMEDCTPIVPHAEINNMETLLPTLNGNVSTHTTPTRENGIKIQQEIKNQNANTTNSNCTNATEMNTNLDVSSIEMPPVENVAELTERNANIENNRNELQTLNASQELQEERQPFLTLEELSKSLVAEIYGKRKRKRKCLLKIDSCIMISAEKMRKQFEYEDTLRCFDPRDDVYLHPKRPFKGSQEYFQQSCLLKHSKDLLPNFKRNTTTENTSLDMDIFKEIFDLKLPDINEIIPNISKYKRNGNVSNKNVGTLQTATQDIFEIKNNLNNIEHEQNQIQIENHLFNTSNPSDPSNPSNPSDPSNPLNPSNPSNPSNPTNPSDPSNPSNPSNPTDPSNISDLTNTFNGSSELPQFENLGAVSFTENPLLVLEKGIDLPPDLHNDLIATFRVQENKTFDTIGNNGNLSNNYRSNRNDWGKEQILRKLLYLWKKQINPIHMEMLCKNTNRKNAAFEFYSIIELSKHKYVKLSKNGETNEIGNIEMGERLKSKLNGQFII